MESCRHPEMKGSSACSRCHLQQARYPVNGYAKEYLFPHEKAPGLRCVVRCPEPTLFMTIRRPSTCSGSRAQSRDEIAEPRRETSARSPEDPMRTRAVRGESEGRARLPEACRSSGSAWLRVDMHRQTIAADALMNNTG